MQTVQTISRRTALRRIVQSSLLTSAALALPGQACAANVDWDKVVVLLELKGGNDGLNTVVPFTDPIYRKIRPTLALAQDQVINVTEQLGFNPVLAPLMPLWKEQQMATILGVGYPKPNLSHFRGIDIWHTASDSEEYLEQGWISRLFSESRPERHYGADAINLGRRDQGPLAGNDARLISFGSKPEKILSQAGKLKLGETSTGNPALKHLLKVRGDLKSAAEHIIERKIADVTVPGKFPETNLGAQFETAARLLSAGVKVPVLKLSIGGFDTHIEQRETQDELLSDMATSIAVFADALKKIGLWNNVVVMSYSEFGRRPLENDSLGTDHGTSSPQFLFGGRVRGGIYGEQPSLAEFENNNLKHSIHFRSIYAAVARDWWSLKAAHFNEQPLHLIS